MNKAVEKMERDPLKVLVQISTSDEDSLTPHLISYIFISQARNFP